MMCKRINKLQSSLIRHVTANFVYSSEHFTIGNAGCSRPKLDTYCSNKNIDDDFKRTSAKHLRIPQWVDESMNENLKSDMTWKCAEQKGGANWIEEIELIEID